jgi:hypothetical protein
MHRAMEGTLRRSTGPTILDVVRDFFPEFLSDSWQAWRVFLSAVFGVPIPAINDALFRRCTARQRHPEGLAREVWLIIGRRGGKSRVTALLATFLACFQRYELAAGERGVLMVIAADRRQARIVKRYIAALIHSQPMLTALVVSETKEAITLNTGITIEIHTASFRTTRGYTVVSVIADEIAFWPTDDAANPDTEILNALRPGMATVPGALLIALSSPYARRGELWRAYKEHFGRDMDPILVWQADTRTMNPTVSQDVVDEAYAADHATASAEYGAEFRRDVDSFVSREALESVVIPGRFELPALPGLRYVAFVDPSGGSSDSMTVAVAHRDGDRAVLDCVREHRPPFSPEAVVAQTVVLLRKYQVTRIVGDRWGGEWAREPFRKAGIEYRVGATSKSDLFRDVLPLVNSGQVELLDHPRLLAQFVALERRTARGGKESIDHAPGAHDDICNAAAGALLEAMRAVQPMSRELVRYCLTAGIGQPDPFWQVRPDSYCPSWHKEAEEES